jgi:uncharacterized membrane-anchored protein
MSLKHSIILGAYWVALVHFLLILPLSTLIMRDQFATHLIIWYLLIDIVAGIFVFIAKRDYIRRHKPGKEKKNGWPV